MVTQLFAVLLLLVVVLCFGALLLGLAALIGPKYKKSAAKLMPYECGIVGEDTRTTKVSVKFYLTAILFILFDIEVIFMYPWALVYVEQMQQMGGFLLAEMLVFMGILLFGLFYVWKGRALQWE